jgi:hypothetical protein
MIEQRHTRMKAPCLRQGIYYCSTNNKTVQLMEGPAGILGADKARPSTTAMVVQY